MNGQPENIIVNSCELTPVYLIPSTSVTQAGSYIITQGSQEVQKPIADNLKSFYENSGNLESGILSSPRPRILRKQSSTVVGNNLKLASFLLPKTESINVQNIASLTSLQSVPSNQPKKLIAPVNNVIVKPVATAIPVSSVTTVIKNDEVAAPVKPKPLVDFDSKIVRVGTIPNTTLNATRKHAPKALPKTKPIIDKQDPNASKYTSVQLIKLGETYHTLNQLSEDQMKIVNKALKMFSNKQKAQKEPAYDPVTNTKFIYKVVSPRDLTVVGKNKAIMKKKNDLKKQKLLTSEDEEENLETEDAFEIKQPKVTRSGRTVKQPKQMRPGVAQQKPKKKVGKAVYCFQCSAEFCSFYRLQRHYDLYPTHMPTRVHSNLFHCLLAVIKGSSESEQANMFVQQLEQLVQQLKCLWPCLVKEMDGVDSKLCTIGDELSRLFGIDPGTYSLNIDALNCVKDEDGHCIHNQSPKPIVVNSDERQPLEIWYTKHTEEILNNEADTEDCARIHPIDKCPTVSKRNWKLKRQKQNLNVKKMRLTSENELPIEPGIEELLSFGDSKESDAMKLVKANGSLEPTDCAKPTVQQLSPTTPAVEIKAEKPKSQTQYHSAHFDIRSSPIKLPSSLVRRFQLNPDKVRNFEVQIMRPHTIDKKTNDTETQPSDCDLQDILDNVELPKETTINTDVSFDPTKDWSMSSTNDLTDVNNYIKTDILFESGLTPEKNDNLIETSFHVNKENYLLETPTKNDNLIEANILEINNKTNDLVEHAFMDVDDKGSELYASNQRLMHVKDEHNVFFNHLSLHVETKCNSLIGSSIININKDKALESALLHVKERSNNLFDTSLLHTSNKSDNLVNKHENNLFSSSLLHVKNRSNSLFESSLLGTKDKVLNGTSLLQDDNSNLFPTSISHSANNGLLNDKSNGFEETFSKVQDPISIDVSQDSLGVTDSRLLSNPSQSMLNFLDALGNESLGLGYPETEIRNNSVDFHLDLFSFSNS